MNTKPWTRRCLLLFFVLPIAWVNSSCVESTRADSVTTFDDIDFWVGEGANFAALAIDWDDTSDIDQALVWGYRWDGSATSEDMLLDIVEADDRFYVKLSAFDSIGIRLYGLGYDLNDDCQFSLEDSTPHDEDTVFDDQGVAISGVPDSNVTTNPAAYSADPADLYAEGWATAGYWRHAISNSNPFNGGSWGPGFGLTNRVLTNGSWDSWTFTPTYSDNAMAENPFAADTAAPNADFDADGDVDGRDFLAWQRGFGITDNAPQHLGDANHDCSVDAADLLLWQVNFNSMTSSTVTVQKVPEPSTTLLVLTGIFLFPYFCRKMITS